MNILDIQPIYSWMEVKQRKEEEENFHTSSFASACRGASGHPAEGILYYLWDSCLLTFSLILFIYHEHVSAAMY